jgi:hypothetical protein
MSSWPVSTVERTETYKIKLNVTDIKITQQNVYNIENTTKIRIYYHFCSVV